MDFNFSKRLVPAQQENWPFPRFRVESFNSSWLPLVRNEKKKNLCRQCNVWIENAWTVVFYISTVYRTMKTFICISFSNLGFIKANVILISLLRRCFMGEKWLFSDESRQYFTGFISGWWVDNQIVCLKNIVCICLF